MSSPQSKCERASHSYKNHKTPTAAMIDPFPTRIIYAHVKTMFLNLLTEDSIRWIVIVAGNWKNEKRPFVKFAQI
jgi:hypothetical protein